MQGSSSGGGYRPFIRPVSTSAVGGAKCQTSDQLRQQGYFKVLRRDEKKKRKKKETASAFDLAPLPLRLFRSNVVQELMD